MKTLANWIKFNILPICIISITLFAISFPVFRFLTIEGRSDIPAHIQILQQGVQNGTIPIYSIFYYVLWSFSLFDASNLESLRLNTVVILTFSKILTGILSYYFFNENLRITSVEIKNYLSIMFSIFLSVMMPVFHFFYNPLQSYLYIGTITSNVWHNSTVIFAMPSVVLSFILACKFFEHEEHLSTDKNPAIILGVSLLLTTLCKPNFAIAFLPAFAVMYLLYSGIYNSAKTKDFAKVKVYFLNNLIIIIPSLVALSIQYFSIFTDTQKLAERRELLFAPFVIWRSFTSDIGISALRSFILPILVMLCLNKQLKSNKAFQLALVGVLVALSQFILLADAKMGVISSAGDWVWGAYMCTYLLLMCSILNICVLKNIILKTLLGIIIILQFSTGVFYIANIIYGMGYL